MKVSGFLFVIMILLFSCKEDEGSYHGGYYWVYGAGLKDMDRGEAVEGISEKWKIKSIDAGGCTIDGDITNKIKAANKKTFAAIEKEYGKHWMAAYDKDLHDFAMKKIDVMDVLITNKLFREELKKHYIEVYNVDKKVFELNNEGEFKVIVYNNELKYENKECFRLAVNTKNRTVNLIQ
ncbi:FEKKY domain-containing protein [Chryseobacterium antibioticum]